MKINHFKLKHEALLLNVEKHNVNCFNRKFHQVVTWQFSCSLVPEFCQFKLSSKEGNISAALTKHTDLFNRGPSALPLRIIEDTELTPFRGTSEIREFLDASKLLHLSFASSWDGEQVTNPRIPTDPLFCLRKTIADLWVAAHERPKVATLLIRMQLYVFLGSIIIYIRRVFYCQKK